MRTNSITLICFCLALGSFPFIVSATDSTISVQSAVYGERKKAPASSSADCTSTITKNLQSEVSTTCNNRTSCTYTVPTPSQADDPAFGCYKSFNTRYTCSDDNLARAVDFGGVTSEAAGQTAKLSCVTGNGINILEATYGATTTPVHVDTCPNVPKGNATTSVQSSCQGQQSCTYTVGTTKVGGDPAFGCKKNFVVKYTCHGARDELVRTLSAEADGQQFSLDCGTPPSDDTQVTLTVTNITNNNAYYTYTNTVTGATSVSLCYNVGRVRDPNHRSCKTASPQGGSFGGLLSPNTTYYAYIWVSKGGGNRVLSDGVIFTTSN